MRLGLHDECWDIEEEADNVEQSEVPPSLAAWRFGEVVIDTLGKEAPDFLGCVHEHAVCQLFLLRQLLRTQLLRRATDDLFSPAAPPSLQCFFIRHCLPVETVWEESSRRQPAIDGKEPCHRLVREMGLA